MMAGEQLLLKIGLSGEHCFETFIGGEEAVRVLRSQLGGIDARDWFVYLWGPPHSGVTHLLQAACQAGRRRELRCVYVSLRDEGDQSPALLRGLEQCDLVCLDDIDSIAGRRDVELALLDLFERCRGLTRLLVGAAHPSADLPLGLADLVSRLGSGITLRTPLLDEEQRLDVLSERARYRGMRLPDDVLTYMVRHLRRDLASLIAALDRLDRETVIRKKPATVRLVRDLFGA